MKTTLLLTACIFACAHTFAQFQGPLDPAGFTTVSIPGSSNTWNHPEESGRSDDSYADFGDLPNGATYTDYLVVTDFNFNIPAGATILGIVVEVERSDANKLTSDFRARIVKGGIIGSSDRSQGPYPDPDGYSTYGSPTDLWGQLWNYKDVTNNDFGFAIAAQRDADGGSTLGLIDHIRITVYYSSTLPVNLISFSALAGKNNVQLNWKTADESEMDHYNVERSGDGIHFSSISNVASLNRRTNTTYTSTDNNPLRGTSFYRLKMTDKNGAEKYSAVVAVRFDGSPIVTLFPNPLVRGQALHINNPEKEKYNIRFYGLAGQLVSSVETNSNDVPTPVAKGMLFYRVINKNSAIVSTGKILVE